MPDRRQQLEQLQSLTSIIKTVLQEPGSNLAKIDGIANLLEGAAIELDQTMMADIMLSVFKAGKVAGKDEFKQKIALL